jgi:hypothetical protein
VPVQPALFRQQALDDYARSREKGMLPRIARPPVFLFLWLLLAQVPIYISGPGMIVAHTGRQQQRVLSSALALAFLPATPTSPGASISVPRLASPLADKDRCSSRVEPAIFGPAEIEQRYAPGSAISTQITSPSIVVTIHPGSTFASETSAGSALTAQIQVGTTSILSSVPGTIHRGKLPDEIVLQRHIPRARAPCSQEENAWQTAPGTSELAYQSLPEKGPGPAADEHRRVWCSLPGNDPFLLWTPDQHLRGV